MAGWCVRREAEPYGLKKLGIEKLKPILTRGVLLDIAGHEGTLWMKDNARFDSGAPGIGLEVAKWLAEKQITYVGSDTWPVEVNPNPDPDVRGVVHIELIAKNGIFLHENLDLAALVQDRAYEFAYIFVPVSLKGATRSPGSPIAVR